LNLLENSCQQHPDGPANDYKLGDDGHMRTKRREQSAVIRDMITAISLCNNVTPVE